MKFKRMSKGSATAKFSLFIVIMLILGYVLNFGLQVGGVGTDRGQAKYITKGLDLKGGVSITYEVSKNNAKWDSKALNDTKRKMEQRVQQFSTEAQAFVEGEKRITVEIPGENDADKVLEELGKPGSLYFCTKAEDGVKPTEKQLKNKEFVEIKDDPQHKGFYKVWLTGEEVKDAQGNTVENEQKTNTENVVSLKFNEKGTKAFADMTTQYEKKTSYIIYDGKVISYPTIKNAILGGEAQIDGMESKEAADQLASNIRIGSLSLELDEISHSVSSGQLGSDALSRSIMAGAIGLLLIMLFMLVVYRVPGIAACLSLITYLELMLLALNGYDATLTLPGIAGIILNIGMAVDANVIIYARIREEIARGVRVEEAIKTGFSKATSAIVDGNITTFIAALVLLWRGSGTVKGFATTLAIGIIVQLFTALVVSRILINLLYNMGFNKPSMYGKEMIKKVIPFVQKRTYYWIVSVVVILVGIISLIVNAAKGDAFNYSIEFKSGQTTTVAFNKKYTMDDFNKNIKDDIAKAIDSNDIQASIDKATNTFTIKTKKLEGEKFDKFMDTLVKKYDAKTLKQGNFANNMISSTVSNEMRQDAVVATIIALICMLFYIWFRFRNIQFAISAILCLTHDVLIVIGCYALTRLTVGTTFIACVLTIIGYSINATIVVFDRIRENRGAMDRDDTMEEVVNKSISQTLTRSIYTSLTTFVAVFMIFIMGVSSIKEFTLPLMVGIICGAYSSVCIAGSLWYVMKGKAYDKAIAERKAKKVSKKK